MIILLNNDLIHWWRKVIKLRLQRKYLNYCRRLIKRKESILKSWSDLAWRLQSVMSQTKQSLSHTRVFATPWTAARQASLSITNSRSFLKLKSVETVMPSRHLICLPLLLLPSIFPSIMVFSKESVLHIR